MYKYTAHAYILSSKASIDEFSIVLNDASEAVLTSLTKAHQDFHDTLESLFNTCKNGEYEKVKLKLKDLDKQSDNLIDLIEALPL